MKIVYCLPQLYRPGGIERIVTIKANYLADVYGYDVTLVVADQQGKTPFYELSQKVKVVDLGINYDETLSYPIIKRLVARNKCHTLHKQKLSEILFDIRPDITVSTFTHEAAFLPSIKDGSKKVLEFHFCRGHKKIVANVFHYSFIKKLLYYLRNWQEEHCIISEYDQFIVLTEEDKELWKKSISSVVNIPNILSFQEVKRSSLVNKKAIAVGRFDEQKGFDTLIKIWSSIIKQAQGWQLHIYGQGPQKSYLQQLIYQFDLQDSVFLHQPEKNIVSCYCNSSLYLMSSRYEGWGLVLSEAMQCGLPVVAFGCKCGPKDIITEGGDGFCIDEGDEQKFISSAVKLMTDEKLRMKMGQSAQRNIQRYSLEHVMPQWNKLFIKLAKNKQ